MSDRRVVFDASAVIAWTLNERGAATVDRLLPFAVIPAPNLTEALHISRRRGHRLTSDQLRARVLAIGAEVEPFTGDDTVRAAEWLTYIDDNPQPGGDRLSLGDALCIAVAERLQLPLVGDDGLWSILPLAVAFHAFR